MDQLEAAKILNGIMVHGVRIQFSNESISEVSKIVSTKEKLLKIVKDIQTKKR